MRSVAVGEAALQRDLDVTVVTVPPSGLMELPKRYGLAIRPPGALHEWLESVEPGDAVLFDGYGFTTDDHTAASRRGARLVRSTTSGPGGSRSTCW